MSLGAGWPGFRAGSLRGGPSSCSERVSVPYLVGDMSTRQSCLRTTVDCYRNKTRSAIESIMQDVKNVAPHYETRAGKRKWNERVRSAERRERD